jgi:hypothetical protein
VRLRVVLSVAKIFAKVLSGNVSMEVEDALTPQDKAEGYILACQAKVRGDVYGRCLSGLELSWPRSARMLVRFQPIAHKGLELLRLRAPARPRKDG